ncbi:hypothetical protein LBMAG53_07030 [Planctomycetota bacterium]|nr:hypothetical protein LBMAG53_07030 [Planctomycetota bacterium]
MTQNTPSPPSATIRFGCAWYPEHWPESRWDADLDLMVAAGMNVVRVGEFAWSSLEPQPDRFTADWLERAIARAAAHGLATVIGTPTAAPPAWLTTRHPEVLRVGPDGRVHRHGKRCHFDPLHPVYLQHCRRIAGWLAERFGSHQAVIGWQIDNEFSDLSHGPVAANAFRHFLRRRFSDLDQLNRAWSGAYWSLAYDTWDQIEPPDFRGGDHPGLLAAWRDFATEAWTAYAVNQAEVIRVHAGSRQFVTTNATFEFARQDSHVLFAGLDLCAADVYLGSGAPLVHLDPGWMGVYLAAARGVKQAPFWVMETQPGTIDWFAANPAMDPGEVRRMVFHQIAHGADAVLFWQWRSAPNCQEQYHGCLIGQGGRPRPIYDEVATVGAELRQLAPLLASTSVQASVAVLWTYRDRGLIDSRRLHQGFDPWRHLRDQYAALRRQGIDVDVTSPWSQLDGYRLCLAPHLAMLDPALEERLLAYVAAGGILILGPRSGTRDPDASLLPSDPPGDRLGAALGGHVRESYCLTSPLTLAGDIAGSADIWGEWLEADAPDTVVNLRFGPEHPWLAGKPAMLTRNHGRGRIGYLGTWPDEPTLAALAAWLCDLAGVSRPWAPLPPGIEVSGRRLRGRASKGAGDRQQGVHIVINHSATGHVLPVPFPVIDAFTGAPLGTTLHLAAGALAVLIGE